MGTVLKFLRTGVKWRASVNTVVDDKMNMNYEVRRTWKEPLSEALLEHLFAGIGKKQVNFKKSIVVFGWRVEPQPASLI
jgi:hypothetical protein